MADLLKLVDLFFILSAVEGTVQRLCLPNGTWMMDWEKGEPATYHSCTPPNGTNAQSMIDEDMKYVSCFKNEKYTVHIKKC